MFQIKNYRDVGASINEILGGNHFNTGVLYRSGALDDVSNSDDLPPIKTIVNLRRTEDPDFENIRRVKIAPNDTMNNYVVESEIFKEWIQRLYDALVGCTDWPLLMHCNGGKDRTGVGVALLLKSLDISDEVIVKEYMRGDHGNRYPESMEQLLLKVPSIDYLKMSDHQIRVMKSLLLQN